MSISHSGFHSTSNIGNPEGPVRLNKWPTAEAITIFLLGITQYNTELDLQVMNFEEKASTIFLAALGFSAIINV